MRYLLTLFLALSFSVPGYSEDFDDGIDYEILPEAINTNMPDKVVVTEQFWYGCPHCYHFEPLIEPWAHNLPENVVFQRLPSTLNPRWATHARTYYALQLMGLTEQTHSKIFDAIHKDRKDLGSYSKIANFLSGLGVDIDQFGQYYNSFEVETQLRRDRLFEKKSGATGVPTVIINGKYRTGGGMAGSFGRMLKIMDYLVQKELKMLPKNP